MVSSIPSRSCPPRTPRASSSAAASRRHWRRRNGICTRQRVLTAVSIQQSLYRQERRRALVLDQEHQEFRRIGSACVPVDDMYVVRAFIEGLSWRQRYLLPAPQLHHNGALEHGDKRMCIV